MFGASQLFTLLGVFSLTSFGVSLPYTSQFQNKEGTVKAEICPAEFTGLLPHPEDCSLFYHCNDGKSNLKSCPSSLHFNPATSSCDWPWNVPNCSEGANPTTSTTERPAPPDTEICRPGFFGYQNFPESCNYYIICADGTAILRKCESGTSFDSKDAVCKNSNLVEDCGSVNPTTTVTTQVPTTLSTTTVVPTTSTSRATTTTEESITENTTTGTTTRPTTTTQRTTTRAPSTTTTTQRTTTTAAPGQFSCPPVEFIYMPHPNDCNKFYLCRDGRFISIHNCGVNLWFHSDNQICRVPWGPSCK